MALSEFFSKLMPSNQKIWAVKIVVQGAPVLATAFEENEHGMWHISYAQPGTYKEYVSKWITPTPEQRAARDW